MKTKKTTKTETRAALPGPVKATSSAGGRLPPARPMANPAEWRPAPLLIAGTYEALKMEVYWRNLAASRQQAASAPPAAPTRKRREIVADLEEGSWIVIASNGRRERFDISGRKQWAIIDKLIYAPEPGWAELPRNWRALFKDEARGVPGKAEAFAGHIKAEGRGRNGTGRFRLT